MGRVGHGVFEMASDMKREWDEFGWMGALSRETGLPVTFAALQSIAKELPLSEQIEEMTRQNASGGQHRCADRAAGQRHRDELARHGASLQLPPVMGRNRGPAVGRAAGEIARSRVQGAAAG